MVELREILCRVLRQDGWTSGLYASCLVIFSLIINLFVIFAFSFDFIYYQYMIVI
jgi:hypothetical protein